MSNTTVASRIFFHDSFACRLLRFSSIRQARFRGVPVTRDVTRDLKRDA